MNHERPSPGQSEIEEISELAHDGALLHISILPEFVVDYVKIASRAICVPQEEIAADYIIVVVPLKEQLDKEIRRKGIDRSAIDGVGRETSVWQIYGIPFIVASDQQVWDRSDLSIQ